jgi:PleD family two-component response regulator
MDAAPRLGAATIAAYRDSIPARIHDRQGMRLGHAFSLPAMRSLEAPSATAQLVGRRNVAGLLMAPSSLIDDAVLLVDDQAIVAEAIRTMLAEEPDVQFQHGPDVTLARPMARKVGPTVILQNLVMPDTDGFTLVRFFRGDL